MPTPRLRAAWALAVVASAGIALVSGTVFVIAAAVGSDDDTRTADEGRWQRSLAWAVSVRRTADPHTAVVGYDVPAGQPDCYRHPAAKVDRETGESIHISLSYEVGRMDCTLTSHGEIAVSARWYLRSREIVVNGSSWKPSQTSYKRCGDDGCTPPPPPQCAADRVDTALTAVDAAGGHRVRSCTTRWLVADTGDRRWFFEYLDQAWHPLLGTRNSGCASIRTIAPEFPAALCDKLG